MIFMFSFAVGNGNRAACFPVLKKENYGTIEQS